MRKKKVEELPESFDPTGYTEEQFAALLVPRGFTPKESQTLWLFTICTGIEQLLNPAKLSRKDIVMDIATAGIGWRWFPASADVMKMVVARVVFLAEEYKRLKRHTGALERARIKEFGSLEYYYFFCNILLAEEFLTKAPEGVALDQMSHQIFTKPEEYTDEATGYVGHRYTKEQGGGELLVRVCRIYQRLDNAGLMMKDLKHVAVDELLAKQVVKRRKRHSAKYRRKPVAPPPTEGAVPAEKPKRGRPRKIRTE
jgi:hypothetical protein